VGISFDIGLSSFCFITAHLAAHQYAVGRRTFEFQKISQEIGKNLGKYSCNHFKSSETMIASKKGQSLSIQSFSRTSLEKQFDFVFWSGDMNYRIHSSLQEVEELLRRNCHRELYQMDQLENVKWCTPSFFGFSEGPVNFRPTYKLVTNSGEFGLINCQSICCISRYYYHYRLHRMSSSPTQICTILRMEDESHHGLIASFTKKIQT